MKESKFEIGEEVFLRSNSSWRFLVLSKRIAPVHKIVNGKSLGICNILEYSLTAVDDFNKKSHNKFDERVFKVMEDQIMKCGSLHKLPKRKSRKNDFLSYAPSKNSNKVLLLNKFKGTKKTRAAIEKTKSKKPLRRVPISLKKMVWDEYFGSMVGEADCPCCEWQKIRQMDFHCAHIKAFSKGGATKLNNLIPCCSQCTGGMQAQNFNIFKKKFFN